MAEKTVLKLEIERILGSLVTDVYNYHDAKSKKNSSGVQRLPVPPSEKLSFYARQIEDLIKGGDTE